MTCRYCIDPSSVRIPIAFARPQGVGATYMSATAGPDIKRTRALFIETCAKDVCRDAARRELTPGGRSDLVRELLRDGHITAELAGDLDMEPQTRSVLG